MITAQRRTPAHANTSGVDQPGAVRRAYGRVIRAARRDTLSWADGGLFSAVERAQNMRKLPRKIALIGIIGGLALGARRASAEDNPKADPVKTAAFNAMDTNHDGRISEDEYAAATKKLFKTMDTNHDNKISAEELTAESQARWGKDTGPFGKTAVQVIKMMDKDGDGVLTAAEYEQGCKERFRILDHDGDHYISPEEYAAGTQLLK
jgi:Ca2+-binding EF-hand superfamily protein